MTNLTKAPEGLERLSRQDQAANVLQGVLKSVPYIGPAIEQFIYGPAVELRFRRIEQTLTEVAEALEAGKQTPNVSSEEYASLLESVLPRVGRATNEDVRLRFRDLLLNTAPLGTGSSEWEDASLARTLLEEIDAPGLAVMAALGRCPEANRPETSDHPWPNVSLVSRPFPQLVVGEFDYNHPHEAGTRIAYDWATVEEWVHRLREKRLLGYSSSDARGGFGGMYLNRLGLLLIRWTLTTNDRPRATGDAADGLTVAAPDAAPASRTAVSGSSGVGRGG